MLSNLTTDRLDAAQASEAITVLLKEIGTNSNGLGSNDSSGNDLRD